MTKDDKATLVGMVIGDGHLQVYDRQMVSKKGTPYKARRGILVMNHSIKQEEYLRYKVGILHRILGGRPVAITPYTQVLKKTGKTYDLRRVQKGHKYFRVLRRFMYPNGKKTYFRGMLDRLNPEGLALWYQDDGTLKQIKNKAGVVTALNATICTCCSLGEAEVIREYFADVWGIDFRVKYQRTIDKYNVSIRTSECKKFFSVVAPYIHESMSYKINLLGHERKAPQVGDDIV